MTDPTPDLSPDPSSDAPKGSQLRWWIGGGVVLALVVGGFALAGHEDPVEQAADGPQINISVVAPVEPDIQPGEVMGVGVLNNGFDGKLPQQAAPQGGLYAEQPAYVEGDQGWRAEDRWAPGARPGRGNIQTSNGQPDYVQPGPQDAPYSRSDRLQGEPYQERPMSFGFDRPQPDWRAEREARRAALEDRDRAREARRRYNTSRSQDPRGQGDPRYDRPARDGDYY